ncbi:MAG: hypothetical protein WEB03_16780 [Nitriliruptor sp.]|uniref:hypothetical protein n=1 Tax=Nitriliruptor sp. TaxID=2448056 RepID=UPI0034A063C8
MRRTIRHTATLLALGGLAVATSLPAAAQSGRAETIIQRQSILTETSPTGEAGTSRVFTQLAVTGDGPVTVTLPDQSTSGLRSLDGFGKPDVEGDQVVHQLDAGGEDGARARTVADNTAELPVSISVVHRLDGEEVDPSDLAGENGRVEVEYTVRNLTAEPRDIVSFDAENNKTVETMDVAVPMVGSMSLTLPPSFVNIEAPGAVTAGDGRGSTVVNYSLLLFAPLGSEEQVVSWTADSVDTVIPMTSLQVLPVDDRSFGSLNATAEAYKGAAGSLGDLANGALIINSNLQLLGAGASELLAGLGQLADGANALNDGLANTAAPGARQLSDGLTAARTGGGALSTGLGELALGANRLSDGLSDARDGGQRLEAGIAGLPSTVESGIDAALGDTLANTVLPTLAGNLEAGLQENLEQALIGQLSPQLIAGIGPGLSAALTTALQEQLEPQLTAGIGPGLSAALTESLQDDLAPQLLAALQASLAQALQGPPVNLDAGTAGAVAAGFVAQAGPTIDGAFAQFAGAFGPGFAAGFSPTLDGAFAQFAAAFGPGFTEGFTPNLNGAFTAFSAVFAPAFAQGFAAQVGPSFDSLSSQFAAGFADGLADGLEEEAMPGFRALNSGLAQLEDGGGQLAAGAGTASSGAGELASGLVQLDDGAAQLADGLGDAADGSGQIAEGLEAAADGGQRLADGTGALSEGFENQLIAGVSAGRQGASQDYEQVRAVIQRGREGAAPYGVASGAESTTVFQFDVAGVGTEEGPSTPLLAGLAGLALAGAGALGLGLKRRLA